MQFSIIRKTLMLGRAYPLRTVYTWYIPSPADQAGKYKYV